MQFVQKLVQLEKRFEELNQQMADPAVISDGDQYLDKAAKTRSELEEVVSKFREWRTAEDGLSQARGMLEEKDPELAAMAEEEIARLEPRMVEIEEQLKVLLLPKDPLDDKNVVLEIRAGTGSDEEGHAFRGGDFPHVLAVCGVAGLEDGSHIQQRFLGGRPQRSDRVGERQ